MKVVAVLIARTYAARNGIGEFHDVSLELSDRYQHCASFPAC